LDHNSATNPSSILNVLTLFSLLGGMIWRPRFFVSSTERVTVIVAASRLEAQDGTLVGHETEGVQGTALFVVALASSLPRLRLMWRLPSGKRCWPAFNSRSLAAPS
jgi:hypothetical protein